MRVVAFTTELDMARGGKQRSMLDVCRGLAARGHSIDLLFLEDGNLRQTYADFCHQCLQINTYDVDKGQTIQSSFRFLNSLQKTVQGLQLCRSDEKRDPTVVYIDDHRLSLFAYGLGWWCRWPVIFHIRQPALKFMPRKYDLPIRKLQRFIAVSHQVKQDWSRIGLAANNIHVVHNGIEINDFRPESRAQISQKIGWLPRGRVISYLGRIDPTKGLETFLQAIALLHSQRPNLPLEVLIVGRPVLHKSISAGSAYVESLQNLARRLAIEQMVTFKPFTKQPLALYQLSDLTVLPSVYPEPFGRTLIESMACGTPAIGSRVGGIPEILTGEFRAGLFEPGNAHALAKCLQDWIDWRDFDPNLGDRCRQHVVQNFSLPQAIDQIETVLLNEVKI